MSLTNVHVDGFAALIDPNQKHFVCSPHIIYLTVWVPLTEIYNDSSCLEVARSSHLLPFRFSQNMDVPDDWPKNRNRFPFSRPQGISKGTFLCFTSRFVFNYVLRVIKSIFFNIIFFLAWFTGLQNIYQKNSHASVLICGLLTVLKSF